MRLLFAALSIVAAAGQLAAQSDPRLFRGPLISEREATLVTPDRGIPLEFGTARLFMGGAAPWAALSDARLQAPVRLKTLRPVTLSSIILRVAAGSAAQGMFTFKLRGIGPAPGALPEEFHRLSQDVFRPGFFAALTDDPYPGLLLLHPETKVVFTVEKILGVNGPEVFDNPDATELLWEALGRPSFTQ